MERTLEEIKGILDGTSYTVKANGLQVVSSLGEDLAKTKKWIGVVNRTLPMNN